MFKETKGKVTRMPPKKIELRIKAMGFENPRAFIKAHSGKNQIELARMLGVNSATLYVYFKRRGIKITPEESILRRREKLEQHFFIPKEVALTPPETELREIIMKFDGTNLKLVADYSKEKDITTTAADQIINKLRNKSKKLIRALKEKNPNTVDLTVFNNLAKKFKFDKLLMSYLAEVMRLSPKKNILIMSQQEKTIRRALETTARRKKVKPETIIMRALEMYERYDERIQAIKKAYGPKWHDIILKQYEKTHRRRITN
ncbi:MAG: hypothetical protein ABH821_01195 [archaeon]